MACYKQKDKINYLKSILADELSIKIFDCVIKAHKTRNYKNLQELYDNSSEQSLDTFLKGSYTVDASITFDSSQYFPDGIIELSPDEVFIDGGAYIGDTTLNFIKKSKKQFKKIHVFEALKENFDNIPKIFNSLNIDQSNIVLHNIGLSSSQKEVYFDNGGSGARVAKKGKLPVKLISLDEYLSESELEKITYIKLDIEGSEMDALQGMRKTISTYKPKLAICIYHKPKDIFEIPLFIKQYNPLYKLYIRQHHYKDETVCYAI